jgi:hypothetical protein
MTGQGELTQVKAEAFRAGAEILKVNFGLNGSSGGEMPPVSRLPAQARNSGEHRPRWQFR